MGIVNNPPIAEDTTDTIVENRRFYAYMNSARATDYFIENGIDIYDSRARWDQAVRVSLGTNNFAITTSYVGTAWVAPFACTLKGFTAVGTITSGSHDWEAQLAWHDASYPITGAQAAFTSLVVVGVTGADDDADIATGACDQALATGDLVIPAVRRDGYTTTETLVGTFSFWLERI